MSYFRLRTKVENKGLTEVHGPMYLEKPRVKGGDILPPLLGEL